jgi:hypothetical protein
MRTNTVNVMFQVEFEKGGQLSHEDFFESEEGDARRLFSKYSNNPNIGNVKLIKIKTTEEELICCEKR